MSATNASCDRINTVHLTSLRFKWIIHTKAQPIRLQRFRWYSSRIKLRRFTTTFFQRSTVTAGIAASTNKETNETYKETQRNQRVSDIFKKQLTYFICKCTVHEKFVRLIKFCLPLFHNKLFAFRG